MGTAVAQQTTRQSSVSIFPGKKFPGKREGLKRPGIPENPGIFRLNREIFAISRDFPSREFPGTKTTPEIAARYT
jgi:hypothetical protein